MAKQDDRGLALLNCAYIEEALGDVLRSYFRDGKAAEDLIGGFNAPLGTFAARSKAAFALGLLSAGQLATLDTLLAKWLQRKFNLWDRTLVLLNGTRIPYRNLKIPACAACNNVSLSKVEGQIARALPGGAVEVRALRHEILYLWVAKLFFGILYAEALLPVN